MRKILYGVGIGVLVLIAAFYAFNAYIYNEKQGEGNTFEPYRATLSGEVVCLPHKDPNLGTKECATGLRTEVGEHYALDFALMSQTPPENVSGYLTASGVVTPIERLSANHWQKYDVVGIFSVTDGLKVREQ